jgi:beta-glucanase (GH16 family)
VNGETVVKTYRIMLPALFVLASSVGVAFGSPASGTTHRTHGLSAPSTPAVTHWGKPIFVDNFQGRKLNLKNWAVYNDPNPSRKPVPRRTKSSVKVRHGSLELIGHYQKPYGDVGGGISYNVNQTYGRWVVRFRAAIGAGYGPVILLWPQNNKDWPTDGEIDLAEITDSGRQGLHENLHIGAANHHVGNWIGSVNATKWHTLAVDWLPDRITFWIDGKPEWRITPTSYPYNYIPDTPFHLALQLDQGCDGNCKASKNTPKRVIMQVNWVKIYAAPGSQPVATVPEPDRASVRGVAYSPDGKSLATTDVNGHAYSWSQPADQRTSALTDPDTKGPPPSPSALTAAP